VRFRRRRTRTKRVPRMRAFAVAKARLRNSIARDGGAGTPRAPNAPKTPENTIRRIALGPSGRTTARMRSVGDVRVRLGWKRVHGPSPRPLRAAPRDPCRSSSSVYSVSSVVPLSTRRRRGAFLQDRIGADSPPSTRVDAQSRSQSASVVAYWPWKASTAFSTALGRLTSATWKAASPSLSSGMRVMPITMPSPSLTMRVSPSP